MSTKNLLLGTAENDYQPQLLKGNFLVYMVVCLIILKVLYIALFIPFPKNFFFADVTQMSLIGLLNGERERQNLSQLKENEQLNHAASLKAQNMIKENYFAHESPEGVSPWFWFSQVGYNYAYAGENLAVGFTDSENVHSAWISSSSHRANILNPNYTEVGTAVAMGFGSNSAILVVQLFGSPGPAKIAPLSSQTKSTAPEADKKTAAQETMQETAPSSENAAIVSDDTTSPISAKVLAQSDRSFFAKPSNQSGNSIFLQFLNFIVYHGDDFFRYISYLLVALIGGVFLANVSIHPHNQNFSAIKKSLVLLLATVALQFIDSNVAEFSYSQLII